MKYGLLFFFCLNAFAEDIFMARLQTLNGQINGILSGSFSFWIKNEELVIYGRLFAGFPKAPHRQNVYLGKRCPDAQDDLNLDGFLDISEAAIAMNNIIVPLDAEISAQYSGMNIFPVGDDYGGYFYEKETKYSTFLKDLKSPDENPQDNIVKLGQNEKFSFEGKTVLIQGVSENAVIPETVQTVGEVPAFKTLPIACGVIRKVSK